MIEKLWAPIGTMPLNAVGTTVDLKDRRRLYSGATVSGIRYERDVTRTSEWGGDECVTIEDVADFTITTTTASIQLTPDAEWRPHV